MCFYMVYIITIMRNIIKIDILKYWTFVIYDKMLTELPHILISILRDILVDMYCEYKNPNQTSSFENILICYIKESSFYHMIHDIVEFQFAQIILFFFHVNTFFRP